MRQISTEKQFIRKMYGGDLFLSGVGVMIFILLVVPVLNIVLLSMANTSVQTREIGLKRALGASKKNVFFIYSGRKSFTGYYGYCFGYSVDGSRVSRN